jgi:hypothetical protein
MPIRHHCESHQFDLVGARITSVQYSVDTRSGERRIVMAARGRDARYMYLYMNDRRQNNGSLTDLPLMIPTYDIQHHHKARVR